MQAAVYEATIKQLKDQLKVRSVRTHPSFACLRDQSVLTLFCRYVLCSIVKSLACLTFVYVPGCSSLECMLMMLLGAKRPLTCFNQTSFLKIKSSQTGCRRSRCTRT